VICVMLKHRTSQVSCRFHGLFGLEPVRHGFCKSVAQGME
jgi:hypothetical protein